MKPFHSFFRRNSIPSLSESLKKVVGKAVFAEVERECPDRRRLLAVASERLGKGERILLAEVADVMRGRLAPRVIPTEAQHLPEGITIATMRRDGYIAIIHEGDFRGVICSDPAQIPEVWRRAADFEYLLAPWSEIAHALGESECHLEAFRAQEEEDRRVQQGLLAEKALLMLLRDVQSYGVREVRIALEEKIQYIFTTPDGQSGRGDIRMDLRDGLIRVLENYAAPEEFPSLQVECLEQQRYYRLNWVPEIDKEIQESQHSPLAEAEKALHESTTLPASKEHGENTVEAKQPEYTVSLLLIDDNETFGAVVERFFVREGISVKRYSSVKQALKDITAGVIVPRVVVCDLHMPEMNGVEFLKRFGETPNKERTTLFMLTSDEEVDTEIEAVRSGVEAYLRKNEDPRLLCAHVERALKQKNPSSVKAA
ncbi:response regulator [bacterium]|nr:response regulator [bacterium]